MSFLWQLTLVGPTGRDTEGIFACGVFRDKEEQQEQEDENWMINWCGDEAEGIQAVRSTRITRARDDDVIFTEQRGQHA